LELFKKGVSKEALFSFLRAKKHQIVHDKNQSPEYLKGLEFQREAK
jgi:hypothetical protein